MNKIVRYATWCLGVVLILASCTKEIDPTPIILQKPIDLGDEYYAQLREYKKSKHQIAFGWHGRWTAVGPSGQKFLSSAPDSMDIISIWSKHDDLTPAQIADLRHVQQVKGTRVTFTVFSHNMVNLVGSALENTAENIPAAARMLADTVLKYGYDGIDFDHECSGSDLLYNKDNMTTLLREMRSNLGPDKLILVDGHVSYITEEGWQYANYAVQQAYGSASGSAWESVKKYITPDRFILTENFESSWSSGGQLLKQAAWNPDEGFKGGCGTYHMEYEYAHSDIPYKWIRQAIQIMNPAQNQVMWQLSSITNDIVYSSGGVLVAGGVIPLSAKANRSVPGGMNIGVKHDLSLVDAYNEKNGTELLPLDPAHLSLPESIRFESDSYYSADGQHASILHPEQLSMGSYLAPLRLHSPGVKLGQDTVLYLTINIKVDKIKLTISPKGNKEWEVMKFPTNEVINKEIAVEDVILASNYSAPAQGITIAFKNDPDAIASFNQKNGTSCTTPAASHLQSSGLFSINPGNKSASINVKLVNLDQLASGDYLFALRPVVGNTEIYDCDESQILYLRFITFDSNVDNSQTSILGTALARTDWSYTLQSDVVTFTNSKQMFDNSTSTGWYTAKSGRSVATVSMEAPHTLSGFRLGTRLTNYKAQILENVETSSDGQVWTSQVVRIKGSATVSSYQYFRFVEPVECRYVRMTYVNANSGCSEFGAYEVE